MPRSLFTPLPLSRPRRLLLGIAGALLAYSAITLLGRSGRTRNTSFAPPSAADSVAETTLVGAELMRHVRALAADSMEGRLIGTPGNARARAYVSSIFAEAGLGMLGSSYEHPFSIEKLHIRPPRGPGRVTYEGTNVIGLVRGRTRPDRYIVVSAHYDHLGVSDGEIYNGADDNASGVAALPVIARWFRENPPEHSLLFVAFDGEERGRLGARAFLEKPPVPIGSIVLDVNMDMIGRNAQRQLYAAGTRSYPQLRPPLDSVAAHAPVTLLFGHDRTTWRITDDWTTSSDHGEFHERDIPFVYFGEEDHADYHAPTDDVERMRPDFFVGAVTTVRNAVAALDRHLALSS